MKPSTQADVNVMRRRLRVLQGWVIRMGSVKGTPYRAQVSIHPDKRRAYIHPWDPAEHEPDDFLLHELLHVAFEALRRMPEVKRRWAGEAFVQDICRLSTPFDKDTP